MSPVTKGLLARNRKGSSLLPPSKNLLKPSQGIIKFMHKFYLAISIFFVQFKMQLVFCTPFVLLITFLSSYRFRICSCRMRNYFKIEV